MDDVGMSDEAHRALRCPMLCLAEGQVDSLKHKKSLAEVQEQMQPQLQRLVFILQDTQDRIRAKDHEIEKLKAQLLPHGHVRQPASC